MVLQIMKKEHYKLQNEKTIGCWVVKLSVSNKQKGFPPQNTPPHINAPLKVTQFLKEMLILKSKICCQIFKSVTTLYLP